MKALLVQERRRLATAAQAEKVEKRRIQAEAKKALATPKKGQSSRIRASTAPSAAARRSHKASNVLESNVAAAIV